MNKNLNLHKILSLSICVAVFSLFFTPVNATKTFEPEFNPKLSISKIVESITIDGKLDDQAWGNAVKAANFVERFPGDLEKPEVETEVSITYDNDKLYISFNCYDDPNSIRATMCQRDQFNADDAVAVMIDTYGDASWAYEFYVNPYGVQKDQLWSAVGGEDTGFDLVWESAAQVTPQGYQVEIAIPFSSLRFPGKDVQSWKMDFWRIRPRESYTQYSWAAYDRSDQCWVCQWGTVDGISDVTPGKGLELLPAFLSSQSSRQNEFGELENDNPDGEMVLNGKYAISSNTILEGTVNPDFSQIESDADQIDVNTTFALFYPERRPFFQEGSDLFRTLFNSFYTRTVNDPQYAMKFTHRIDKFSVGFLSALDENSIYIIPLDESSAYASPGKSMVNVVRGLRSFGNNSQFGFLLGDRRYEDDGSGTILAVDHDIRLSKKFKWDGQYILTHTGEPNQAEATSYLADVKIDSGKRTAALDGESYWGAGFISRLRGFSRNWFVTLDYNQVNRTYRTQIGYDPTVNYRTLNFYSNYHFRTKSGLLERITPNFGAFQRWNFDGTKKIDNFNFNLNARLRFAQTNLFAGINRHQELFGNVQFDELISYSAGFDVSPSDKIGFGFNVDLGDGFSRFALVKTKQTSLFAYLNLKPIDRLRIEPYVNYQRMEHHLTGDEIFDGYVARTRIRLQASKQASMRLIVQYNDFSDRWEVSPMVTYRISPFSVFYMGSSYNYNNMVIDEQKDITDWQLANRQFFMKIQYQFQI